MQSSHKKRNTAVVGIISIVVLIMAFLAYLNAQPLYIDYGIAEVSRFHPNDNKITIYYFDRGGKPGNFYLTLKFTNATFSNQTEQPYLQVNNTLVKFLFNKGWGSGWSATPINKTIFFAINYDAPSFSFELFDEKYDQNPISLYSYSVNSLEYHWNETLNYYELKGGISVSVQS